MRVWRAACLAVMLAGCGEAGLARSGDPDDACIEIDRVYTPGVQPGESGRVRVIRRRVPCTETTEALDTPPFDNEIRALRHLARQSFPVEVTLFTNPDWDPSETVVARYIVPSEYFDPGNPPLMAEIADGEIRTFRTSFFVTFQDGRYQSQVQAVNEVVQSVHQIGITGEHTLDSLRTQIDRLLTSDDDGYEISGERAIGLTLLEAESRFDANDQRWVGYTGDGEAIMIGCPARRADRTEPDGESRHYGLCTLSFMAEPHVRTALSFPHDQLDQWRTHRAEALALLEAWRVD
ncbi:hypothetical protein DDZ18_04840 [Marinicauda salina]|uniref:Uncharacterized protein n=1 Tax=Marinicauda salina TaxID=2135793 RepID=A0A2U2BV48_9PROT|nr:hypothetical protein [Marinicauda salina]PWE17906.1 hypothetical protein DDZ18_04840 [Marinicauda salina]